MTTVTFYHSVICPRCQMANRSLAQLAGEFPHITVEKVEYLANLGRSRQDGVRAIPTLVSGERRLTGFYLTRSRIREFLESL
jgi:glutaredoxin